MIFSSPVRREPCPSGSQCMLFRNRWWKYHIHLSFSGYFSSLETNAWKLFTYIPDKKDWKQSVKLINFLKDCQCYDNFVCNILKACHWLLGCTPFVSRSQKFVQENWLQTRLGSVCKLTEKNASLLSSETLRIKLSNANRPYRPKSRQSLVLWDSNLIFDRTLLYAVGESLLCDYPMVVDYILKINLTKRNKI